MAEIIWRVQFIEIGCQRVRKWKKVGNHWVMEEWWARLVWIQVGRLLPNLPTLDIFPAYLLSYLLNYLLIYLLTYSMEQSSSWEANRFSASQEIPRIIWNPYFRYLIHKLPTPVPILIQLDPVHNLTSHFLKSHLNIILPSTPWSPKWSLSLRFSHQNPVYASPLPHTHYMQRPSHSSRFCQKR